MSDELINIPTINTTLYLELCRKRKEFLDRHPEYYDFQSRIDNSLKEIGDDPIERCQLLGLLMGQSLNNLSKLTTELQEDLSLLIEKMNEVIDDNKTRR